MRKTYFENYSSAQDTALRRTEVFGPGLQVLGADEGLSSICECSRKVFVNGGSQFLVGNGASASFANHMALDWTKNGGVPTHSFSNPAILTALGNDLGFENTFVAPLQWYAKPGDLLVTISSSGNSLNILNAIEKAREIGMKVVTFSGLRADNASRKLGDLNFHVPAKTYGIVECAHQVLLHMWLDCYMEVREWDRSEEQNMNKDEFRL